MLCKFDNNPLDGEGLLWYDDEKEVRFLKNLPFFSTQWGTASLVLEEVPYKKCAYVTVQSAVEIQSLLQECAAFCRSTGAEHIYVTGHEALHSYPLHTEIWEMTCPRTNIACTDGNLVAVTEANLEKWCTLYNESMRNVPNAATMTRAAGEKLLKSRDAWFVCKDGNLIGLGKAAADRVDAVASFAPGCGEQVLGALCSVLTGETVHVETASANTRAIRLYSRLGFVKQKIISTWYELFKEV